MCREINLCGSNEYYNIPEKLVMCHLICLIWPVIYPIYLNRNHSIYSVQSIRYYPKNQRTTGIIQYSTQNLRHPNLALNTIDNQPWTVNCLQLTIRYSGTTGKSITRRLTSGLGTAKKTIKPSVVIAKSLNHRQNAASGRFYLPSEGTILWYLNHYWFTNYNDSITKSYWAINAHSILYILVI